MKKVFRLFVFALAFFVTTQLSYSLPTFWYSGVAYNSAGQIITYPTDVEVNITINDGSTIFTETFTGGAAVPTDPFGIFSVNVGTGSNSGNLSSVLMKANTFILVKVRPVSTTTWVTISGASLSTVYYNSYTNAEALLPPLPNGKIYIGNASNVPEAQTMSGDVNIINNTGTTQIQNSAGNSIIAAINNAATTNRVTVDRIIEGNPDEFLIHNATILLNSVAR